MNQSKCETAISLSGFNKKKYLAQRFAGCTIISGSVYFSAGELVYMAHNKSSIFNMLDRSQLDIEFNALIDDDDDVWCGDAITGYFVLLNNGPSCFVVTSKISEHANYYLKWNGGGMVINNAGKLNFKSGNLVYSTVSVYQQGDYLHDQLLRISDIKEAI